MHLGMSETCQTWHNTFINHSICHKNTKLSQYEPSYTITFFCFNKSTLNDFFHFISGLQGGPTSGPPTFRADHPFYYVIMNEDYVPLFEGTFVGA